MSGSRDREHHNNRSNAMRRSRMSISEVLNASDPDSSNPTSPSRRQQSNVIVRQTTIPGSSSSRMLPQGQPSNCQVHVTTPLHQQRRSSTTTISSDDTADMTERRAGRPPYVLEHEAFIWYHRDDFDLGWDDIVPIFERQFRVQRNKQGMQCKYYRVRNEYRAPPVREARRGGRDPWQDPVAYGAIACSDLRYPWMLPRHRDYPPRRSRQNMS